MLPGPFGRSKCGAGGKRAGERVVCRVKGWYTGGQKEEASDEMDHGEGYS